MGKGQITSPPVPPDAVRLSMLTLSVAAIRHRFEHRLAEWAFAGAMLSCGLILLARGATFDLPPYTALRQVAPQDVWGWTMAIIGGLRLVILAINGALERGSPHLRCGFSFLSALIWYGLLQGFWAFPTLLMVEGFLSIAVLIDGVNTYRTAQDARCEHEERGGRNGRANSV